MMQCNVVLILVFLVSACVGESEMKLSDLLGGGIRVSAQDVRDMFGCGYYYGKCDPSALNSIIQLLLETAAPFVYQLFSATNSGLRVGHRLSHISDITVKGLNMKGFDMQLRNTFIQGLDTLRVQHVRHDANEIVANVTVDRVSVNTTLAAGVEGIRLVKPIVSNLHTPVVLLNFTTKDGKFFDYDSIQAHLHFDLGKDFDITLLK